MGWWEKNDRDRPDGWGTRIAGWLLLAGGAAVMVAIYGPVLRWLGLW